MADFCSPTCGSVLSTIGLVFDLVGALALIGIEWGPVKNVGFKIRPEFRHLDSGLRRLLNRNETLTLGIPEFETLSSVLIRGHKKIGQRDPEEWIPFRIEYVSEDQDTGEERVILHLVNRKAQFFTSKQKYQPDHLESMLEDYVQREFQKVGAGLICIGFSLQIISNLLSELC